MKVAFTTSTGVIVDGNFRKSNSFSVWDIGPDDSYYVTTVSVSTSAGSEEEILSARADALSECTIVCAGQISGPAAAKLVARRIHPMRIAAGVAVEEIIGKLQQVLKDSPAPWLSKAQGRDLDLSCRYRFRT
jgi:nitrogen fixation protein NifX